MQFTSIRFTFYAIYLTFSSAFLPFLSLSLHLHTYVQCDVIIFNEMRLITGRLNREYKEQYCAYNVSFIPNEYFHVHELCCAFALDFFQLILREQWQTETLFSALFSLWIHCAIYLALFRLYNIFSIERNNEHKKLI